MRANRIRPAGDRLILTHSVPALAPDPGNPKARLWNPAGASFEQACAALGLSSGTVAIIGGPLVYTLFLKQGYDNFHLSRAVKVWIPDGLPVFIREAHGGEPEAALAAAGLKPGQTMWLDDEVTVTDWEQGGIAPHSPMGEGRGEGFARLTSALLIWRFTTFSQWRANVQTAPPGTERDRPAALRRSSFPPAGAR